VFQKESPAEWAFDLLSGKSYSSTKQGFRNKLMFSSTIVKNV